MKRSFNFITSFIFSLFLIFATLFTPNLSLAKDSSNELLSLDLYLINDFHGTLRQENNKPGAAKLLGAVQTLTRHNPQGSILLGGGDMIVGTLDSSLENGLPAIKILNEFGFTASVLGNHEFDYSKEIVKEQLKTANFPFLSANIVNKNNRPIFKPYLIIQKKGLKIAIIGLTTTQTQSPTRKTSIQDYTFLAPQTVVQKYVKEVRKKGANIVVLLTHIGAKERNGKISGEIIPTLKNSANVDAVFTAHTHKKITAKYKQIPVIQAGSKGKYIGNVHFIYSKKKQRIIASATKLYPINYALYPNDKKVQKLLNPLFKTTNQKYSKILAENKHYLSNDPLAQSGVADLLTDLMLQASNAKISFLNAGAIRYDLEKGAVTNRKLKEVFPYKSRLITMKLKGSDLISTIEHGLKLQSFGLLRFSGLNVTADMNKPIGQRIISITTTDGKTINPQQTYFIATNDFIAKGGDNYLNLTHGSNNKDLGNLNKIFEDYFINKKIINFTSDQRLVLLNYHPTKYFEEKH